MTSNEVGAPNPARPSWLRLVRRFELGSLIAPAAVAVGAAFPWMSYQGLSVGGWSTREGRTACIVAAVAFLVCFVERFVPHGQLPALLAIASLGTVSIPAGILVAAYAPDLIASGAGGAITPALWAVALGGACSAITAARRLRRVNAMLAVSSKRPTE